MPGGDRTGPRGLGPRTGRAAGYCTGYPVPGYANPSVPGYGRGYWGRGRGFGRRGYYPEPYYEPAPYYPPYQQQVSSEQAREEEKAYLEDTIKGLEEEIKSIRERLQELSKEKKETS